MKIKMPPFRAVSVTLESDSIYKSKDFIGEPLQREEMRDLREKMERVESTEIRKCAECKTPMMPLSEEGKWKCPKCRRRWLLLDYGGYIPEKQATSGK